MNLAARAKATEDALANLGSSIKALRWHIYRMQAIRKNAVLKGKGDQVRADFLKLGRAVRTLQKVALVPRRFAISANRRNLELETKALRKLVQIRTMGMGGGRPSGENAQLNQVAAEWFRKAAETRGE